MAILSDVYIADSGRAIRNTGLVTMIPSANQSGNYAYRVDGVNDVIKPSGYAGNTDISVYAKRFNDYGFYENAHSGNFYGAVVADIRNTV